MAGGHGHMKQPGRGRKKGDWMVIARMHSNKHRYEVNRPVAYIPLNQVGSAAYRRLVAKRGY